MKKKSKHDPITLDEAEAVKKWLKYNNMNLARLKKIVNKQTVVRYLSKKVSAKSKHNLRGKDGCFVAAQPFVPFCLRKD